MELAGDTAIKAGFLVVTLALLAVMYNLPRKALSRLRSKNRASIETNRHFLHGARLLSRARSTGSSSVGKEALSEADRAIAILPRNASAHILRGLALEFLGHRGAALRSLDAALTAPAVKTLSDSEKGDALVKRAELQLSLNKRRRVDSALDDLLLALGLTRDNPKAYSLLGQCYEFKGLNDDAVNAFKNALRLDPLSISALQGLDRFNCQS